MDRGSLNIEQLGYSYVKNGCCLEVLRDITVVINPGELFCVLGPSGCGKTTLLHLIAGFLPPATGCIRVSARTVSSPGPDRALVFQDATLFPWLSIKGNIGYGLRCSRKEKQRTVSNLFGLVGLEGWEDNYPYELSGGMRQRVALARALALGPDILLMDEPFAALDSLTRERLQDELLRICHEVRCTVVFVTHNFREAAYIGDRIMVLSDRPARINRLVTIDIPYPRRRSDEQLRGIERDLYACSEMNSVFQGPERIGSVQR